MQFFILVLLTCLFIFLYCVYVLSNDDFIFLRRDVTMEKLFNLIFQGALVSLFTARLFYGLSHTKSILIDPLVFLLIPYFPGLSLLGGVVGAGTYLLFLAKRRENSSPVGRISDFFSIAFLISVTVGFIGQLMFSGGEFIKLSIQTASYFVLFIVFLKFLLPQLLSGKFKEGTITFLFLICFSLISLISNAFLKISILEYFRNFENIISILILFTSSFVIFNNENLMEKFKKMRR